MKKARSPRLVDLDRSDRRDPGRRGDILLERLTSRGSVARSSLDDELDELEDPLEELEDPLEELEDPLDEPDDSEEDALAGEPSEIAMISGPFTAGAEVLD